MLVPGGACLTVKKIRLNGIAHAHPGAVSYVTEGDVNALPFLRGYMIFLLDALGPSLGRSDDYPPQRKAAVRCVWPSGEFRYDFLEFRCARSTPSFSSDWGPKKPYACCAVAHKHRYFGPCQYSWVDFSCSETQIALRACCIEKAVRESEDKFRGREGRKPPLSNSLPLSTLDKINVEQKHKQLAEGPEDQHQRWYIAKGRTEKGCSCSLQGIESVEQ